MNEQVELRFEAKNDGSTGAFQKKMLEYIPSDGYSERLTAMFDFPPCTS